MAFATLDDLRSRWFNMPDDISEPELLAKLDDAAVFLLAKYPSIPNVPADPLAGILRMIVCNMVRRSFTNVEFEGVSRYSEVAGPFTETTSFYNSGDNLYLNKQELDLLENALYGTGSAKAFETWG